MLSIRDGCSITTKALGLCLLGLSSVSWSAPIIDLASGEITRLNYTGHELFIDTNHNGLPDAGDVFEGIISVNAITGATSGTNLSGQLASKEITASFRFTVVANSANFSHLEFALNPGDFFRFYIGAGATKNYDPVTPTVAQATDGTLWIDIAPGDFFDSVNDRQPNGSTLNRAWISGFVNNTGYVLEPALFRDLLGRDANHLYQGVTYGDRLAEAIFDNRVAGPSSLSPAYTFAIFGDVNILAVPEPGTLVLFGAALFGMLVRRTRNRGAYVLAQSGRCAVS